MPNASRENPKTRGFLGRIDNHAKRQYRFSFTDICCGMGGFSQGLISIGGKCVLASEIEPKARFVYEDNFGHKPLGDISKIRGSSIPKHDILCAGFPCQPFSKAGKLKGFQDDRGMLYREIVRILKIVKPKAFILENVENLVRIKGGLVLQEILKDLQRIGYNIIQPQILDAADFGLPQRRRRVFIVGFKDAGHAANFTYPRPDRKRQTLADIAEGTVDPHYYLSEKRINGLIRHKKRHASKGHGFGYQIIGHSDILNTINCSGSGKESNIVYRATDLEGAVAGCPHGPRYCTQREWARSMGFDDTFQIKVPKTYAYKLIGNSVAVPVVKALGEAVLNSMNIAP